MIKIENLDVVGWEAAIHGMRNPMNSWQMSDSGYCENIDCVEDNCPCWDERSKTCLSEEATGMIIGPNDHKLMMSLAKAGSVHGKFRRMIVVYADITAPLYWWKEFDTYKVGTVANSCSTMHKIHAKEFTWEDFSIEHLTNFGMWNEKEGFDNDDAAYAHAKVMGFVIASLNGARKRYLNFKSRGKDWSEEAKRAWWQMIQLLPSSYNQKRTVMLNYEVLANIYQYRREHKLDEWREFCQWIEKLPYSEIITCNVKENGKKPIIYERTNRADCPSCGASVRGIDKPFGDWCAKCGQKLNWEGIDNA